MKLAIHGGKPIRDTEIFYGKQYIDEDDIEDIEDIDELDDFEYEDEDE